MPLFVLGFGFLRLGSHIRGIAYIFRADLLAVLIRGKIGFCRKASCVLRPELEGAAVQIMVPYQHIDRQLFPFRICLEDNGSGVVIAETKILEPEEIAASSPRGR